MTSNGKFIPASVLMADSYCLKCHKDAYDGWFHSSHHFSSFNNKAYLSSVRETRKVALEAGREHPGRPLVRGVSRPGPVLLGEFDDPNYDDVNNPDQPGRDHLHRMPRDHPRQQHPGQRRLHDRGARALPVRRSAINPLLQWINNTLVKAKPEMHKRTFLKPAIKDSKFCSTCHKVGLPYALNHYKDFLRGQNHFDTFLLSGVSGHGARSFYYPPVAKGTSVSIAT